jgi:hypothetical protein
VRANDEGEEKFMFMRAVPIRALRSALLTVFLLFGISSVGQATPLDVNIKPYPVMLAGFINSVYTASTGVFTADGWTMSLDVGTGQQSYFNNFQLRANISNTGVANGGSLLVSSLGTGATLLQSVGLVNFGYDRVAGGTLEFLFTPSTGSLVSTTPTSTSPFDAVLPVDVMFVGTTFTGSWTNNWSSTSGQALIRVDPPTTTVPEPSTLILMLVGAGGLVRRRE